MKKSRRERAQQIESQANLRFPKSAPRDLEVKCGSGEPIYSNVSGREDYFVETLEEAKQLAFKLSGIDPQIALPIMDDKANLIGYKAEVERASGSGLKKVAEVHFHPSDLAGHSAKDVGDDWSAQQPHVNYENWRDGKKNGKYGHIIYRKAES